MVVARLGFVIAFCICFASGAARATEHPDSDLVICGYAKHTDVSPVSDEAFGAWLGRFAATDWQLPMTPTVAHDPLRIDVSASKNFVGHVGGGGGSRAVYDSRHRLLAVCQVYDTASALFVFERIPAPPFAVARADLSSVRTAGGIGLGSTVADVVRVYGPASVRHFSGPRYGLSYERFVPTPSPRGSPTYSPLGIYTWFDIAGGRVTSIERLTGY